MDLLTGWMKANKLKLYPDKTDMILGYKFKIILYEVARSLKKLIIGMQYNPAFSLKVTIGLTK